MAGRRNRRRSGRPPGSTSNAPADPSSSRRTSRKVAIVQKGAGNMSDPPVSATSAMSAPQGWADLPDDLLLSIIVLLRSPHETLAVAATCRPWYSAFLSCLSAFNLFTFFPPVLLRPKFPDSNLYSEFFIDPTNTAATLRCRVPWRTVNKMDYIGNSYGNIIYGYKKKCHLFDAFTGAVTKSPRLVIDKREYPTFGALTAPLASPDSSLLVQAGRSLFQWKVGRTSWLKLSQIDIPINHHYTVRYPLDRSIVQITRFKDEIFAIDSSLDLYRVFLEPMFRLQKVYVRWSVGKFDGYPWFAVCWFVVCDDMLLLVGLTKNSFQAIRLDPSASRKKRMVKVERLENWAVFVGADTNNQAFACKNPERWGGRSNCVYFCGIDEPWGAVQLGEEMEEPDHRRRVADLSSIWMSPGVFSRIRQ